MIKTFGIEGIYVIHAIKGYEQHEQRIRELFGQYKMDFEFVTDGDPIHSDQKLSDKYIMPGTKLSAGVISCTLNHFCAYERIVKNKNRYALIFENDPFFLGDFAKKIGRIVREAETRKLKGFIISLENTCLTFPSYRDTKKRQYLYRASAGRAAGAYMIDYEGAARILNDLKKNKCHRVIDWWHNHLIKNGTIKMYWAHPPLVEQGSHNGLLSSTISTERKSMGRRLQWLAQKYYKMYIRRMFREKRILSEDYNP